MKTALIIRHLAFEDLGTLAPVLQARGYAISYLEMGVDDLAAHDPATADLAVILGGPIGVYETAEYPFLATEIAWIKARLEAGKPTLGICLGSQLMAAALGARVFAGGNGKEIGWSALTLTATAQDYPFMQHINTPVLHWHGDTFELPEQATLLASSAQYPHQIFAVGTHGLGLQCHPEVTFANLERWYIGHAGEIAATPGISVPSLREQGQRYAPALEQAATGLWSAWLDSVA